MPLPGESPATVVRAVPFPEALVRPAQMLVQRAAAVLVLPEVVIDRLVADREDLEASEPSDHLLGAEVFAEHRLDERPLRRGELRVGARNAAARVRARLRLPWDVAAAVLAPRVARDFSIDGARTSA